MGQDEGGKDFFVLSSPTVYLVLIFPCVGLGKPGEGSLENIFDVRVGCFPTEDFLGKGGVSKEFRRIARPAVRIFHGDDETGDSLDLFDNFTD